MKRILILVSILSLVSSSAFAWGLPSMPSITGGSSSGGSGLSADQLQDRLGLIGKDYFGASKSFMMSSCNAEEAFGFKKDAELLKSEANQCGTGVLNGDDVEKVTVTLSDANEKIKEKIRNGEKLDEQGKKLLLSSMGYMGKGIVLEIPLVATIANVSKSAKDSLKSAPITQIGKIKDTISILMVLSKNVTKDLSLSKDTLGLYIDYAKANGIEIPKDASNVFN
jgi:hypothetical protein